MPPTRVVVAGPGGTTILPAARSRKAYAVQWPVRGSPPPAEGEYAVTLVAVDAAGNEVRVPLGPLHVRYVVLGDADGRPAARRAPDGPRRHRCPRPAPRADRPRPHGLLARAAAAHALGALALRPQARPLCADGHADQRAAAPRHARPAPAGRREPARHRTVGRRHGRAGRGAPARRAIGAAATGGHRALRAGRAAARALPPARADRPPHGTPAADRGRSRGLRGGGRRGRGLGAALARRGRARRPRGRLAPAVRRAARAVPPPRAALRGRRVGTRRAGVAVRARQARHSGSASWAPRSRPTSCWPA